MYKEIKRTLNKLNTGEEFTDGLWSGTSFMFRWADSLMHSYQVGELREIQFSFIRFLFQCRFVLRCLYFVKDYSLSSIGGVLMNWAPTVHLCYLSLKPYQRFSPTLNVNKPSSFYRNVRGIIYHCDWTRHYLHSFLLQVLEHQRAGNIHRPSCMLCGDFISSLYLRTVFHVCALVLTFNIFHYIQKENIVLVNWP